MIGLLTFHWADDYGALLQAFALKKYLKGLGEQVEVIPYAPVKLTGRYQWCPLYARIQDGTIRYKRSRYGWKNNLSLGRKFFKRRKAMKTFRQQYLTAERPERHAQELILEKYSSVIVGSDQI